MEVFNVTKTNGNDKFSVFPDPDLAWMESLHMRTGTYHLPGRAS